MQNYRKVKELAGENPTKMRDSMQNAEDDVSSAESQLERDGEVDKAYPVWLKSSVEVQVNGRTHTKAAAPVTKGHPDNPLSVKELDAKYLSNVGVVLGPEQAAQSLELLNSIEERSAREIVESLRAVAVAG